MGLTLPKSGHFLLEFLHEFLVLPLVRVKRMLLLPAVPGGFSSVCVKRRLLFLSVRVKRRLLFPSIRGDFQSMCFISGVLSPSVLGGAGITPCDHTISVAYDRKQNTRKRRKSAHKYDDVVFEKRAYAIARPVEQYDCHHYSGKNHD